MSIPEKKLIARQFTGKVHQTIKDHNMLQKGMSVLVGVSGGPDSMALLHSLMALSDCLSLRLGVAHLNHCLRDEASDTDEEFVIAFAEKNRLPCYVEKKNIILHQKKPGYSLEETGRIARYHFFKKISKTEHFDKIAVGHHQDDNAELILLYLLRGTGLAGISGIPPVRENIIRPLIQTNRSEIIKYLKFHGVDYRIDESNVDEKFQRNKIRHHLIPLLQKAYNPKLSEALNRLGHIIQTEEDWINQLINPIYDKTIIASDKQRIEMSVSELTKYHIAQQRRIIRKAIQSVKGDLRRITFSHIDSILLLLKKKSADKRLDLPGRVRIVKQFNQLIFSKENINLRSAQLPGEKKKPVSFEYMISKSDIMSNIPIYLKEINTYVKFSKSEITHTQDIDTSGDQVAVFDWDILQFPIQIRNYRKGDCFTPLGMTGTQKLKNFFINNKIKPRNRLEAPLFLNGDTIIWIGGYRISDSIKMTSGTKAILTATLFIKDKNNS